MAKYGDPSPSTSSPSLKVTSGEQLVKNARKKVKSMGAGEMADVKKKLGQQTPSRDNHLVPQSIAMETDTPPKKQSIKLEQPVKQEPPSPEQLEAVVHFCSEALGRGVLSLADLRNRLLLKQMSLSVEGAESQVNLLSQQSVSDRVLEEALSHCGAIEVGQPCNKRLFALSHGDAVSRSV